MPTRSVGGVEEAPASMCVVHRALNTAVHKYYLVFPKCADIAHEVADSTVGRQRHSEAPLSDAAREGRGGSGWNPACNSRREAQYVKVS